MKERVYKAGKKFSVQKARYLSTEAYRALGDRRDRPPEAGGKCSHQ